MGKFYNNPNLKMSNVHEEGHNPKKPWVLQEDLRFYSCLLGEVIVVPAGYRFDGASVPWFFRRIFPKAGPYLLAACVHDWLCDKRLWTSKIAAKVFLEAMRALRIPVWRRHPMYQAVRWFGPQWK